MALLNFTSGIRLTKSINSFRGEWAQQQYVLPSTYKGGDAEFCVRKQQASCLGWNNFCSLNGKRQQLNSFNSTFIQNSTNTSSTTSQSTLDHHVDESRYWPFLNKIWKNSRGGLERNPDTYMKIHDLLLCSSTKIKQSRWCGIQVELHKTLLKQKCFA